MSELIQCYCGNEHQMWHNKDHYQEIECDVCNRSTGEVEYQEYENPEDVAKEVVKRWNTRHPHPAIKAVYDLLKEHKYIGSVSVVNGDLINHMWQAIRKAVEDAD